MTTYPTHSWRARRALANREPYKTGGAMYATTDAPWDTGKLYLAGGEWLTRYATERNDMAYVVVSYRTPIAWVLRDGTVVKVDHKWSRTTTSHQGLLYALDASWETRQGITQAAERELRRESPGGIVVLR